MDLLTEVIIFRCSQYEKNKMRLLAEAYAEGELSSWLRYAGINAERRFIEGRRIYIPRPKRKRKKTVIS